MDACMTNLVLDISFGERERSPQNNLGSCVVYTWTMALEVLSYGRLHDKSCS